MTDLDFFSCLCTTLIENCETSTQTKPLNTKIKKEFSMKKELIILILLIPMVCADYDNAEEFTLDVNIDTNIRFEPSSDLMYVSYSTGLFPKDTSTQKVLSQEITPNAKVNSTEMVYEWNHPKANVFDATSRSIVRTRLDPVRIRQAEFPVKIPVELQRYTQSTPNIDANDPEIVNLASGLAEGHDDLTEVVFELFTWVRENVEYNMSTLTSSVSRPASWVLENRYGVCDEITTLFMAMSRSVGIPARYVSGVAYSDFLDIDDWQPHGWAELYFPEYGWVPFDITYDEFAYIDPTHVIFRIDLDTNQTKSMTEWKGNAQLMSSGSEVSVDPLDQKSSEHQDIKISISAVKDKIGFGSYNLIEAKITNLNDYYVARNIRLGKTERIRRIEKEKFILIGPGSSKKIYWLIQVDPDLSENYRYQFPLTVYSGNTEESASFSASQNNPYYTKQEMEALRNDLIDEMSLVYSGNIKINCTMDKAYVNEKQNLTCSIENRGNVFLRDLSVCLEEQCSELDIPISKYRTVEFAFKHQEPGYKEKTLKVQNTYITRIHTVNYTVLDRPSIILKINHFTNNISGKEKGMINLTLVKNSTYDPRNVSLTAEGDLQSSFSYAVFDRDTNVLLHFNGKDLHKEVNTVDFVLTYYDEDKIYRKEESITISRTNIGLAEKAEYKFMQVILWIELLVDKVLNR